MKPEIVIESSKIKSLKTLKISDARRVVLTPQVVNALAENDNQLETVDFGDIEFNDSETFVTFFDHDFMNNLKNALNNLMQKKFNTLKHLRRITFEDSASDDWELVSLENISLCHRLEEFCGYLTQQEIEALSALPKLKRLQLQSLTESPKYLLENLNLACLQYLTLHTDYLNSLTIALAK